MHGDALHPSSSTVIFVHTLGTARIDVGDRSVGPTSVKKFALLLYLTAEAGRPAPRGVLYDLLFPDLAEKNAQHALRELVYQLRRMGAKIEATPDGVWLPAEAVRSDWSEVVRSGRPDASQLRAIEGGFLPGYAPAHSEGFAEWFDTHRSRVGSVLTRMLSALLREHAEALTSADAEQVARAILAIDPLNEAATLKLAESHILSGSRAKASSLLDHFAESVGRAPELTRYAAILRGGTGGRLTERWPINGLSRPRVSHDTPRSSAPLIPVAGPFHLLLPR